MYSDYNRIMGGLSVFGAYFCSHRSYSSLIFFSLISTLIGCGKMKVTFTESPLVAPGSVPNELSLVNDDRENQFTCTNENDVSASDNKRLTKYQVVNSIKSLFGDEFESATNQLSVKSLIDEIPDDGEAWNFADFHSTITLAHTKAYFNLSIAIADKVYGNSAIRAYVFGNCVNVSPITATCIDNYLDNFATRILRRPLDSNEKVKAKSIYSGAPNAGEGFIRVLAYHLFHPSFLIHWELGTPSSTDYNASPLTESERLFSVTSYELASKIAFLITDTTPDVELLAKAADGSISNADTLRAQVTRLMETPSAREKFKKFGLYWADETPGYSFSTLPAAYLSNLNTNDIGNAAIEESKRFMEYMIWERPSTFSDLLTSKASFAKHAGLAEVYNHAPSNGSTPATFGDERRGLFNRLPFLYNGSTRSSIILRGVKFRENVLCQTMPSPPNEVFEMRDNDILTDEMAIKLNNRDVTAHRTKSAACISCHSIINPTGNIFENFDSLGRYRTQEKTFDTHGVQHAVVDLNTSDKVPLWSGNELDVAHYSQFIETVSKTYTAKACFSKKLSSYANNVKKLTPKDSCRVKKVYDEVIKSDGSILNAIVSSIANPAVRLKRVGD